MWAAPASVPLVESWDDHHLHRPTGGMFSAVFSKCRFVHEGFCSFKKNVVLFLRWHILILQKKYKSAWPVSFLLWHCIPSKSKFLIHQWKQNLTRVFGMCMTCALWSEVKKQTNIENIMWLCLDVTVLSLLWSWWFTALCNPPKVHHPCCHPWYPWLGSRRNGQARVPAKGSFQGIVVS